MTIGETGWGARLGGRWRVPSHTLCVPSPCPWRRADSPIRSTCGPSHITGAGTWQGCRGLWDRLGGQPSTPGTGVAWLSLAAAVASVETKEQVGGPSQPSHNKHLHCGGAWSGGAAVGETLTMPGPPPAPLGCLLTPAAALGLSPSCHRPAQEQSPQQVPGSWFLGLHPGRPESQDTHADTRWRPPLCPAPTGGPGRRAGSAHSPHPWCCAGIGRPAGPPRQGHTRWRVRYTCTWDRTWRTEAQNREGTSSGRPHGVGRGGVNH